MSFDSTAGSGPAISENGYTVPVTVNLVTIEALQAGLHLLGISWMPVPYDENIPPSTNGLYAWIPLSSRAILYIGIGQRVNGNGLAQRLKYELGCVGDDYIHGHSLTMRSFNRRSDTVIPYCGDLTVIDNFDYSWIDDADWSEDRRDSVRDFAYLLRGSPTDRYKAAERFAIRLSMHLGDIGAPVNSTHRGAWKSTNPAENAAEFIAAKMAGRI